MVVSCQPYAPAAFTPRKFSWYSFLLEAESSICKVQSFKCLASLRIRYWVKGRVDVITWKERISYIEGYIWPNMHISGRKRLCCQFIRFSVIRFACWCLATWINVLMAETEMKNRGDKIVSIICKFGANCAHGRLFYILGMRAERIHFMSCFFLVQENEWLYDDHSLHTNTLSCFVTIIHFSPESLTYRRADKS